MPDGMKKKLSTRFLLLVPGLAISVIGRVSYEISAKATVRRFERKITQKSRRNYFFRQKYGRNVVEFFFRVPAGVCDVVTKVTIPSSLIVPMI